MDLEYLCESTERLEIRPMQTSDYENWLKGFKGRGVSKTPYDEGRLDMSICTESWYKQLIEKHHDFIQNDKIYIFGIFRKSDGIHIGNLDIVTLERSHFQWGECGYSIHNQFFRQGYGFESLTAMLKIADKRLKFHRLEAHVNIGNEASIKLLQKAGFESEGIRKNFIFENGEWTDHLVFAKVLNDQPPINM